MPDMSKGIVFAGNLIVDHIKYVQSYPPPSALTSITNTARSTGGLACNCATCIARLDPSVPVKVVGITGNDEHGEYIINQLSAFPSVDVSGILRMGETSYTDVITENGGRRTFFHYRGANALLSPEHFDFSKLKADILHVGYILLLDGLDRDDDEYPTAMCRVLADAKKSGIATSIDVVSEDGHRFASLVPPALKYADYCIINELEASFTTGVKIRGSNNEILEENLPEACRRLIDMGVGRWAVIHMQELSCGMDKTGQYVLEHSWKIPNELIISSVGAGDAFASAILYSAYKGRGMRESLRIAGAVAAYSLSGAGASDSIKQLPEILNEMEGWI